MELLNIKILLYVFINKKYIYIYEIMKKIMMTYCYLTIDIFSNFENLYLF